MSILSKASLVFSLFICLLTARGPGGMISTMWQAFWAGSALVVGAKEDGRPMGAHKLGQFDLSGIN